MNYNIHRVTKSDNAGSEHYSWSILDRMKGGILRWIFNQSDANGWKNEHPKWIIIFMFHFIHVHKTFIIVYIFKFNLTSNRIELKKAQKYPETLNHKSNPRWGRAGSRGETEKRKKGAGPEGSSGGHARVSVRRRIGRSGRGWQSGGASPGSICRRRREAPLRHLERQCNEVWTKQLTLPFEVSGNRRQLWWIAGTYRNQI